jgi:hypothetical protein
MTNITLRALLIAAILTSAPVFAQDSTPFDVSVAAQATSHASDARCPLDEENFRCNPSAAK